MIDYFTSHLWQFWAIISVVCLVLELSSGDFFIMCFAIGGVCAAVAAGCDAGFYWQLAIFVLAAVISIFTVRPVALKYFHRNDPNRVSNADAIIGRKAVVSQTIEAGGYGRVSIDGDDWKATSAQGNEIPRGTTVTILSRDSIILTVTNEES